MEAEIDKKRTNQENLENEKFEHRKLQQQSFIYF